MPEGHTAEVPPGTLLGRVVNGHEIVRVLGAGGMGEVYLARHQILGVHRAIKVIHDNHRADDQAARRFEREAVALGKLQHHNVVQIIDFGTIDNGWPFLCMEFIEGRDLDVLVEANGPLPLPDALQVLAQLASALDYAHKQGIIHRDLKPANAILRHDDPRQVKVIDFGLARMVSKEMMTRLTAEQQMLGSPMYMAPEQADGSLEITGGADVYALAGIAYWLLSGKPVFPDRPLLALIYAHSQETPERLSTRLEIPGLLDSLLDACLAKKSADRPAADELSAHFQRLAQQLQGAPRPAPIAPPPALSEEDFGMMSTMAAGSSAGSGAGAVPDAVAAAQAAVAAAQAARVPTQPPQAGEALRAAAGSINVDRSAASPDLHDSGTVKVSESMADQVTTAAPAGLAELLLGAGVAVDPTGLRDAVVTQAMAVVGDIASIVAYRDPAILQLQQECARLESALTDIEMDLAVIDADLADSVGDQRGRHMRRRAETGARTEGLRVALREAQRELVDRVDRARDPTDAQLSSLHRELDTLTQRLR